MTAFPPFSSVHANASSGPSGVARPQEVGTSDSPQAAATAVSPQETTTAVSAQDQRGAASPLSDRSALLAASVAVESAASSRPGRPWVPIRSLGARHRARIATHLTALDERSRYLRFGYPANDAQIHRYVDMIDFDQDEVFGIFNRRLELIALAHLAHSEGDPARGREATSEFGVSVLPKARRSGYGRRLFEHAMLHARNRGVQTIMIQALSENTAMIQLARSAGAIVERDGPDSEARLKLPPGSFASKIDQALGEHAAEFDYRLKLHTRRPDDGAVPLMPGSSASGAADTKESSGADENAEAGSQA